jgi:hypothetical protein
LKRKNLRGKAIRRNLSTQGDSTIVEETDFKSLLAICATPMPSTIRRYKDVYYGLAHIGNEIYLAISRDGPKERAPFVEYDLRRREWKLVNPKRESLSGDPSAIVIPSIYIADFRSPEIENAVFAV